MYIYTHARPFVSEFDYIQRNAVKSWRALGMTPTVFVERMYDAMLLREISGLTGVMGVKTSERYIPLVNSIISLGESLARHIEHEALIMANTDNIFLDDIYNAVSAARAEYDKFCLVGRRYNLDIEGDIDFSRDWRSWLRERIATDGTLASFHAIDWFAYYPSGLFGDVPDFAIGRGQYDCWLLRQAVNVDAAVIDVTDAVTVIHQNHSTRTATLGRWGGEVAKKNRELAGDDVMGIDETPLVMTKNYVIVERGDLLSEAECDTNDREQEELLSEIEGENQ